MILQELTIAGQYTLKELYEWAMAKLWFLEAIVSA
jgi:hypothetical protein